MNAISPAMPEPDPIEIDPRPCELCGRTIDQHQRVDTPEGPEFFCEELERQIHLDAAALRHPSAASVPTRKKSHHTAQATVEAFLFVVRLGDADHLTRWLAQHPLDAPHLLKIWERKNALA